MKRRLKLVRGARGSGIVEASMGLSAVSSAVVGAVLLIVNIGSASFYKERLALVTREAARYAVSLAPAERQEKTCQLVAEMLTRNGFSKDGLSVNVSDTRNGEGVEVKVRVSNLSVLCGALLGGGLAIEDCSTDSKADRSLKLIAFGGMRANAAGVKSGVFGPKGELCLFPIVADDHRTSIYELEKGQISFRIRQ